MAWSPFARSAAVVHDLARTAGEYGAAMQVSAQSPDMMHTGFAVDAAGMAKPAPQTILDSDFLFPNPFRRAAFPATN